MNPGQLLDTHIVLWYLCGDARLKPQVRLLIDSNQHPTVLSIASIWEVSLKYQTGKFSFPRGWDALAYALTQDCPWALLPVTSAHVLRQAQIPGLHKDPFDRLLVAQALVEDLTLVTSDARILRYPVKALRV